MSESALYAEILRELSCGPTRLFRQQSMLAWAGKVFSKGTFVDATGRRRETITLIDPHPVKFGTQGMADLGGLTSIIITPDMLGQRIAIDVQIEGKSRTGCATPEQRAYLEVCRSLGGRAGIARTVEDARRILAGLDP